MSEQPEALRLAEWAEWFCRNVNDPKDFRWVHMAKSAAELRRLHAENEALRAQLGRAAVVQQEPAAWICEEQTIGPNYAKKRLTFSRYYSDNPLHYKHTPLYTHPAPQAKQPLTDERCPACDGTGRMVRDPDIGTDQERFVCAGTGSKGE